MSAEAFAYKDLLDIKNLTTVQELLDTTKEQTDDH